MKRSVMLILTAALAACVSDDPQKGASFIPSGKETAKPAVLPNISTADYMTEQENELKNILTGTSFQLVRSNNILAIVLPAKAVFKPDEEQPTDTTKEVLQNIADVLSRYSKTRISIIGYADTGVPKTDRRTSEKRAKTVAGILKKNAKISSVRFWVEGSMPPVSSENKERPENNHIDIILTPTFIR